MLTDRMIAALSCPVCRAALSSVAQRLTCANGHSFDVARQGYAPLTGGRRLPAGDTAAMVAARSTVLAAGHYAPLANAVAEAARRCLTGKASPLVIEPGAGIGYYLVAVLDAEPSATGIAGDVSKPALRRAARAHQRMGAVLADTWHRLPLADQSTDLVLSIFAPRNSAEFHRVLRPAGHLLTVTPEPDHLAELRAVLPMLEVPSAKQEQLAAGLPGFAPVISQRLSWTMSLTAEEAHLVIQMGPSAYHVAQRPAAGGPVTASTRLTTWCLG